MKVLLIHAEEEARKMLAFVLESNCRALVTMAADLKGGFEILGQRKDFDLVVYNITNLEKSGFFEAKQGIPALVACGEEKKAALALLDKGMLECIAPERLNADLLPTVQRLLQAGTLRVQASAEESAYCRIPASLLVKASPLGAGVYIRLSTTKHLKIFSPGDVFDDGDLKKYSNKKLDFLYLKKDDVAAFSQHFSTILDKQIRVAANETDSMKSIDLSISVQELNQELVAKFGFTPEVNKLLNQNVDLAVGAMKNMPSLQDLIGRIDANKDRYIPAHSALLASVACSIAKAVNYNSEATYQKLTMAAFLHDITLTNHKLAHIRTLEELEKNKAQFTEAECEEFRQHPKKMAEIAKTLSEKTPDVDNVILEHHEFGDGTGFPRKLNSMQINAISAVFMIAHEFVLLRIEGQLNSADAMAKIREKFNSGSFKQVLRLIDKKVFPA